MIIRDARPSDAEAMSVVLIASITELCGEDHQGRPEAIAAWTANKTPESIRGWFDNPEYRFFVADEDGAILGVGGFSTRGEIILNYVAHRHASGASAGRCLPPLRAACAPAASPKPASTARRPPAGSIWAPAGRKAPANRRSSATSAATK